MADPFGTGIAPATPEPEGTFGTIGAVDTDQSGVPDSDSRGESALTWLRQNKANLKNMSVAQQDEYNNVLDRLKAQYPKIQV